MNDEELRRLERAASLGVPERIAYRRAVERVAPGSLKGLAARDVVDVVSCLDGVGGVERRWRAAVQFESERAGRLLVCNEAGQVELDYLGAAKDVTGCDRCRVTLLLAGNTGETYAEAVARDQIERERRARA
jgi:hypothetical protein